MPRDDESPRQAAKRERREDGERSARLARQLMGWKESSLDKLQMDPEVREELDKARKVTSQIARRRAEREFAAFLRAIDLDELEAYMINIEATNNVEPRLFKLAESWRTKLIEGGIAAAAEFPGGNVDPLPKLIQNARREKDSGKPPGAQRALFRHVMEVLRSQPKK